MNGWELNSSDLEQLTSQDQIIWYRWLPEWKWEVTFCDIKQQWDPTYTAFISDEEWKKYQLTRSINLRDKVSQQIIFNIQAFSRAILECFEGKLPPELDWLKREEIVQILSKLYIMQKISSDDETTILTLIESSQFQKFIDGRLKQFWSNFTLDELLESMRFRVASLRWEAYIGFREIADSLLADPVEVPELIQNAQAFVDPEVAMGIMRGTRSKLRKLFLRFSEE
jgi:hypothetical protein